MFDIHQITDYIARNRKMHLMKLKTNDGEKIFSYIKKIMENLPSHDVLKTLIKSISSLSVEGFLVIIISHLPIMSDN